MKLVADANVLFSLVKKGSATEKLVQENSLMLYSVDYVLEELRNHEKLLLEKSGLKLFAQVIELLEKNVVFYQARDLKSEIQQVKNLVSDEEDLVYLALAKKLNLVVWSNDKHLKQQNDIEVVSTKELIELLY